MPRPGRAALRRRRAPRPASRRKYRRVTRKRRLRRRRRIARVPDPAEDDRPVGVALLEVDDDLLTDLRRRRIGDADPTRAVLVVPALAVPVELDLDAAVLVDEVVLAR